MKRPALLTAALAVLAEDGSGTRIHPSSNRHARSRESGRRSST
jgi:hypothetical protein